MKYGSAERSKAATLRPTPPPAERERGSEEHKYLQHLVKRVADERGIRATIEELILGGKGHVDLSLVLGDPKISCEISVTMDRDHELKNVEKCIAARYEEVLLVGATKRHA